MKTILHSMTISVTLAILAVSLCSCAVGAQTEQTDAERERNAPEAELMTDLATYKSGDGWSVQYHTKEFDLEEGDGFARFLYKEGTPDAGQISEARRKAVEKADQTI